MKKFLFVATVFVTTAAVGQKVSVENIPTVVTTAFHNKFPDATKVKWEKEGNHEYEAEFRQHGTEMSAGFDESGRWLETEQEIKAADFPTAVSAALKKDFSAYKIDEAAKIESVKFGSCYEAELKKDKDKLEVIFATDGRVLNNVKEEDDDD